MSELSIRDARYYNLWAPALRAAIHDARLEASGIRIVYFFDADVVVGSLYANKLLDERATYQLLPHRHIVLRLFLGGFLTRVRLTLPHLIEYDGVLKEIVHAGGISSFLTSRGKEISRELGIESSRERMLGFTRELLNSNDDARVKVLVNRLSMEQVSEIESSLASLGFHPRGALEQLIDIDSDLGEEQATIQEKYKDDYERLLECLKGKRPFSREGNNEADAASLIAISKLWERDYQSGTYYRFYTHTNAINECANQVGRELVTEPSKKLRGISCSNHPNSLLRGSFYFLFRGALNTIGFRPEGSRIRAEGWAAGSSREDMYQERIVMKHVIHALAQGQDESDVINATRETIRDSFFDSLNREFLRKLLERSRISLATSIRQASMSQLSIIAESLTQLGPRVIARVDVELKSCRARIGFAIAIRCVLAHLKRCDVLQEGEVEESISRWAGLWFDDNQGDDALNGLQALRSVTYGTTERLSSWLDKAIERFANGNSIRDITSVAVPLLTLGQFGDTTDFLRGRQLPGDPYERFAFLAIRLWCKSLMWQGAPLAHEELRRLWRRFTEASYGVIALTSGNTPEQVKKRVVSCWLAVYVSFASCRFEEQDDSESPVPEITKFALDCTSGMLIQSDLKEATRRSVCTARLLLMSNELLVAPERCCKALADRLSEELERVEKLQFAPDPGTYLENALNWANWVRYRKDARYAARFRNTRATFPGRAFESYQIETRRVMARSPKPPDLC